MSSVKTFESSQTDETYMLNTPEGFGLRPKVSGKSKTGCNLRTISIVLAILASITVIVGTTLGIVRSIKKQGLEPITDQRCSTGQTEYHFGSKRKCYKNIGPHKHGKSALNQEQHYHFLEVIENELISLLRQNLSMFQGTGTKKPLNTQYSQMPL